jgi:hypothetical protein
MAYAAKELMAWITTKAAGELALQTAFPGNSQASSREADDGTKVDEADDAATDSEVVSKRYFRYRKLPTQGPADADNTCDTRIESITVRFQNWGSKDTDVLDGNELLMKTFLDCDLASCRRVQKTQDDYFEEPKAKPNAEEVWQGVVEIEYTLQNNPRA